METKELIELAKSCGFEAAAALKPTTLHFLPQVRMMCAADKCRSYNRSWSCPPAAGELSALAERCGRYSRGLLVQTVGHRSDAFDFEAILDAEAAHKERFSALTARMRALFSDVWPMGTGACTRCDACTWPDAPCRFPGEVFPPMEACGLLVSQVCADNGLPYYYGPDSISFTSCYLFC